MLYFCHFFCVLAYQEVLDGLAITNDHFKYALQHCNPSALRETLVEVSAHLPQRCLETKAYQYDYRARNRNYGNYGHFRYSSKRYANMQSFDSARNGDVQSFDCARNGMRTLVIALKTV